MVRNMKISPVETCADQGGYKSRPPSVARYNACSIQQVSNSYKISYITALDKSSNNPGSQPLVTLDFPAPLQQRVINALKADPNSVDLRAQAPRFYPLGARILDLFEDDDMVDVLTEVDLDDVKQMTLGSLRPALTDCRLSEHEQPGLLTTHIIVVSL